MLKVIHISNNDISGGAQRSSYRIHRSICSHEQEISISSNMRVLNKISNDVTIQGHRPLNEFFLWPSFRKRLQTQKYKGFTLGKHFSYSIAWPDTGLGNELNNSDADIFHLHFIGNDSLSVREIGNLNKPIVWTFHDMWAFCGAEHYVEEQEGVISRYIHGYSKSNRSSKEHGKDLNLQTWERKIKHWKKSFYIVCPSLWMASEVRRSFIFKSSDITIIPYPLDLDAWSPIDKHIARSALGLDQHKHYILFGAVAGTADPRKGGDLLVKSLQRISSEYSMSTHLNIELLVFGQTYGKLEAETGLKTHYLGHLYDDLSLKLLYSAADLMMVPSRQDNLPNTAIEAMACGTPVVAFKIGGLPDIVEHQKNGWLSIPFDTDDMALGIKWILENKERHQSLCNQARISVENKYNPQKIASMYAELYKRVIKETKF